MFFFSLLATTGAASTAQMPLLFLEFLKIRCCFSLMRKCSSIFIMVFSFDTLLRRKYFDTLLRCNNLHKEITCFVSTIDDDGIRQVPSVAAFFFEKWKTIMLFLCQANFFHWFLSSRFRLTHFCEENILTHFCEENILSKNAV